MSQANGKALVKTGRTIDEPSREPGAASVAGTPGSSGERERQS